MDYPRTSTSGRGPAHQGSGRSRGPTEDIFSKSARAVVHIDWIHEKASDGHKAAVEEQLREAAQGGLSVIAKMGTMAASSAGEPGMMSKWRKGVIRSATNNAARRLKEAARLKALQRTPYPMVLARIKLLLDRMAAFKEYAMQSLVARQGSRKSLLVPWEGAEDDSDGNEDDGPRSGGGSGGGSPLLPRASAAGNRPGSPGVARFGPSVDGGGGGERDKGTSALWRSVSRVASTAGRASRESMAGGGFGVAGGVRKASSFYSLVRRITSDYLSGPASQGGDGNSYGQLDMPDVFAGLETPGGGASAAAAGLDAASTLGLHMGMGMGGALPGSPMGMGGGGSQRVTIDKLLEELSATLSYVSDFLRKVPEEVRLESCFAARMENYKKDQNVYRIGDTPDKFYIILTGSVEIWTHPPGTRHDKTLIAVLKKGQSFGELAIINDEPRAEVATPTSNCTFLTVHRSEFMNVFGDYFHERHVQALDFFRREVSIFKAVAPAAAEKVIRHMMQSTFTRGKDWELATEQQIFFISDGTASLEALDKRFMQAAATSAAAAGPGSGGRDSPGAAAGHGAAPMSGHGGAGSGFLTPGASLQPGSGHLHGSSSGGAAAGHRGAGGAAAGAGGHGGGTGGSTGSMSPRPVVLDSNGMPAMEIPGAQENEVLANISLVDGRAVGTLGHEEELRRLRRAMIPKKTVATLECGAHFGGGPSIMGEGELQACLKVSVSSQELQVYHIHIDQFFKCASPDLVRALRDDASFKLTYYFGRQGAIGQDTVVGHMDAAMTRSLLTEDSINAPKASFVNSPGGGKKKKAAKKVYGTGVVSAEVERVVEYMAALQAELDGPGTKPIELYKNGPPAERFYRNPLLSGTTRGNSLPNLIATVYPEGLAPLADKLGSLVSRAVPYLDPTSVSRLARISPERPASPSTRGGPLSGVSSPLGSERQARPRSPLAAGQRPASPGVAAGRLGMRTSHAWAADGAPAARPQAAAGPGAAAVAGLRPHTSPHGTHGGAGTGTAGSRPGTSGTSPGRPASPGSARRRGGSLTAASYIWLRMGDSAGSGHAPPAVRQCLTYDEILAKRAEERKLAAAGSGGGTGSG